MNPRLQRKTIKTKNSEPKLANFIFPEVFSLTDDGRREYLILKDVYDKYVLPYRRWSKTGYIDTEYNY